MNKKTKNILEAAGCIVLGVIMIGVSILGIEFFMRDGLTHDIVPKAIAVCIGVVFIAAGIVMLVRILCGKNP